MLRKKPKKPTKGAKYHHHAPEGPVTKHIKNVPKIGLTHHEKLHGLHHVANKPKDPMKRHEHIAGLHKIKAHHPHLPKSYFATPPAKLGKPVMPKKPRKG
jgi:hypothetical protein